MRNNYCDGARDTCTAGEVRVLPTGGGGNAILCKSCFNKEIQFRKERNKDLGDWAKFDLPSWDDLKVYEAS